MTAWGRWAPRVSSYLLAVAVLGVLLATLTPAPHTGGDNATYLSLGQALASGDGYTEVWDPEGLPHTKYPPVFPAILGALFLLGAASWTAYKLMLIGTVLLAVGLVFAWGFERRGRVAASAIAGLTVLSAGWLDAARWILSEPLFLAFTFLALWASERGVGTLPPLRPEHRVASRRAEGGARWLLLAGGSAALALFTRSAGLPLVLSLLAALLLQSRVRAASILGVGVALPAGWWMVRARTGSGEGAYQSEFWMRNPYEPDLGLIGWFELPARGWANLRTYVAEVLPVQWWGPESGGLIVLGAALGILALWGWTLRVRRGAGVAELFGPLYLGLILLWPEVWTGERFLIPLVPLVLLYAGEAVRVAALPLGRVAVPAIVGTAVLLLALPAIPGWLAVADEAGRCRRSAAGGDVFLCHGAAFQEFRDASAWIGVNLPPDAAVLNRKPSTHHLLGGRRGRIYPFTLDPDLLLEEADRLGARYVLLDHLDGISPYYLGALIHGRPRAFCYIAGWGGGGGRPGTDLLGILPSGSRPIGGDVTDISPCPAGYRATPGIDPLVEGLRIPRFVQGSPAGQSSFRGTP